MRKRIVHLPGSHGPGRPGKLENRADSGQKNEIMQPATDLPASKAPKIRAPLSSARRDFTPMRTRMF
jgi:hypothetical protein